MSHWYALDDIYIYINMHHMYRMWMQNISHISYIHTHVFAFAEKRIIFLEILYAEFEWEVSQQAFTYIHCSISLISLCDLCLCQKSSCANQTSSRDIVFGIFWNELFLWRISYVFSISCFLVKYIYKHCKPINVLGFDWKYGAPKGDDWLKS